MILNKILVFIYLMLIILMKQRLSSVMYISQLLLKYHVNRFTKDLHIIYKSIRIPIILSNPGIQSG